MKWKLIGTCKISGQWNAIKDPAAIVSGKKSNIRASIDNSWVQRSNGSWKKFSGNQETAPVLNFVSHIDSIQQIFIDKQIVERSIKSGLTDVTDSVEGVYYKIINSGTGNQVSVTDTVT